MMSSGQTVWVTGASSGIGEALVRKMAMAGIKVVATARSRPALEALSQAFPGRVVALPADLSDAGQVASLAEALGQHGVNGVVLNAGTCVYIDPKEFRADTVAEVVGLNLVAQARCLEVVLPRLRQKRAAGEAAWIAGVSSSAWWFPFPRAEAYGASKAGFTYLLRSLRADLAAEGIPVALIEPGFVETPLTDRNDFDMPFRVSADEAADIILAGLRRGRAHIHFPRRFTWLLGTLSAMPGRWVDRLAASLSRNAS